MSFVERVIDSIPPQTAHAVGVSSGLTGLALWAEVAKHLTVMAGFMAVLLTITGAGFYAVYWALKSYARYKRIRVGDFKE